MTQPLEAAAEDPHSDLAMPTRDVHAPPVCGDDVLDGALAELAAAATAALEDQVHAFDAVHRVLQDRLADVGG